MAVYVPTGIFTNLSASELSDLRQSALAAITGGQWTSITGGLKTGSLQYQMSPQETLVEIRYAEQQNGIIPPRGSKVYQNLNCQYRPYRFRE